jgi:hypothetical protein
VCIQHGANSAVCIDAMFLWAQEGVCHAGTKACKVVFLGNTGHVLTTGFSRHSDRQYAVWNQSDLSSPLCMETIDCSSGVLFPYYDHDTRMVFLAGKVSYVALHVYKMDYDIMVILLYQYFSMMEHMLVFIASAFT